jgi:hypothetical protein
VVWVDLTCGLVIFLGNNGDILSFRCFAADPGSATCLLCPSLSLMNASSSDGHAGAAGRTPSCTNPSGLDDTENVGMHRQNRSNGRVGQRMDRSGTGPRRFRFPQIPISSHSTKPYTDTDDDLLKQKNDNGTETYKFLFIPSFFYNKKGEQWTLTHSDSKKRRHERTPATATNDTPPGGGRVTNAGD